MYIVQSKYIYKIMKKKDTPKEIVTTFNEASLDPEAGIKITEDEDLYLKTLTSLIEHQVVKMIEDIRTSMIKRADADFRRTSHSLKGASPCAGCTRMHKICESLQFVAEVKDYKLVVQLFNELTVELKKVQKEYSAYATSKGVAGKSY